jgi:DtxR family Mn-dependent transcriptional regulator
MFVRTKRAQPAEKGGTGQVSAIESGAATALEPDMLEARRRRLMEWVVTEFADRPDIGRDWGALTEQISACKESSGLTEALDRLCSRLGHPRYCPHGKPIPVGACCLTNAESEGTALFRTLRDLEPGETARLLYLSPRHQAHFYRLSNMGFTPGAMITLQQKRPVRVLRIGRAQVALDDEVADHIFVRPLPA